MFVRINDSFFPNSEKVKYYTNNPNNEGVNCSNMSTEELNRLKILPNTRWIKYVPSELVCRKHCFNGKLRRNNWDIEQIIWCRHFAFEFLLQEDTGKIEGDRMGLMIDKVMAPDNFINDSEINLLLQKADDYYISDASSVNKSLKDILTKLKNPGDKRGIIVYSKNHAMAIKAVRESDGSFSLEFYEPNHTLRYVRLLFRDKDIFSDKDFDYLSLMLKDNKEYYFGKNGSCTLAVYEDIKAAKSSHTKQNGKIHIVKPEVADRVRKTLNMFDAYLWLLMKCDGTTKGTIGYVAIFTGVSSIGLCIVSSVLLGISIALGFACSGVAIPLVAIIGALFLAVGLGMFANSKTIRNTSFFGGAVAKDRAIDQAPTSHAITTRPTVIPRDADTMTMLAPQSKAATSSAGTLTQISSNANPKKPAEQQQLPQAKKQQDLSPKRIHHFDFLTSREFEYQQDIQQTPTVTPATTDETRYKPRAI